VKPACEARRVLFMDFMVVFPVCVGG